MLNILLDLKMYLGFKTLRKRISANDINKPGYRHTLKVIGWHIFETTIKLFVIRP